MRRGPSRKLWIGRYPPCWRDRSSRVGADDSGTCCRSTCGWSDYRHPCLPDTAAPDASVERAATNLTSAAGPSRKIRGERRASTGTLFPLAVRYNNNSSSSSNNIISSSNGSNNNSSSSSNSNSSSSNNDTITTCAVALLRPFDPGKGCQRDTRRGKAVIGLDLPFDRGKAWRRTQHGGLRVSSSFCLASVREH